MCKQKLFGVVSQETNLLHLQHMSAPWILIDNKNRLSVSSEMSGPDSTLDLGFRFGIQIGVVYGLICTVTRFLVVLGFR